MDRFEERYVTVFKRDLPRAEDEIWRVFLELVKKILQNGFAVGYFSPRHGHSMFYYERENHSGWKIIVGVEYCGRRIIKTVWHSMLSEPGRMDLLNWINRKQYQEERRKCRKKVKKQKKKVRKRRQRKIENRMRR